ncbi:ABC transporter permease subunit [Lentzea alba]|uniref:ABC transporter permease n=1 Tax=Lentzea alba TaxID=2714351 RepID=UPI0039BFCE6A
MPVADVLTRPATADAPPAARRQEKPWRRRLRRDWPLLVMVAPAISLYVVFHYIPLLGNVIAFQNYSPYTGILASPFTGLYNFERIFTDGEFWQAAVNTVTITLFQLVFYFPVPILLALLLNSLLSTRLRMLIQSVVYLPHFFSWVLVITLFQQMFGGTGAINTFLREHGAQTVDIMNNPDLFLGLVTLQSVWKDAGWGTIIFLAALSTVDSSLYEAAAVDGAGRWRRLWHVTLPALVPVIVLLLILRLGDALSVGFEQFLLQRDAVGADTAEVLDTYVYFTGVVNNDWSYAAAAGLVKGVVGLLLVLGANRLAHVFGQQGVYQR